METMEDIRATFFEECDEQLGELDKGLAGFARGETDQETIGVVYRAVHSIKGGAASFDLHELANYAKLYEEMLKKVRGEELAVTPDVLDVAGRSRDLLKQLVAVAKVKDGVVAELKTLAGIEDEPAEAAPEASDDGMADIEFSPVAVDLDDVMGGEATYRIVFHPMAELYANAHEATRLIRQCLELGTGTVSCEAADLPALDALNPEGAYLTFTIELTTDAGEGGIREVFEFAEWDCELSIERISQDDDEPAGLDLDAIADPEIAALFARLQAESPDEAGTKH
ncbi:Hpt domain-containing protein [Consotaella salsifontis]|uniref:Two-component system, chemotaxis family, sensor kinase CheA n=1 Tax=Consotaella salsifontis TaxID=1365950 RepID=A0A1T4QSV6_9HYPH|nr:Hpt domain-containing protein [Consotaella salsifontis]SKA06859.1 two-component system, chemotaxis family, sensor kinase CheA [Consotaella salsifontis]